MDWKSIDSQADLEFFAQSVCWEDSDLMEFCGPQHNEDYFPLDISRPGYNYPNLHVLYNVCSAPDDYLHLHLVLICCDHFSSMFLHHPSWRGRVDTLKRVETYGWENSLEMRCSRMIYRFIPEKEVCQNLPYLYQSYLCRHLAPPEY